ncbi:T9SS type A sorting domain-containing protein [Chryseobacterium vietnamense]|nr:T9SS type A sorting domain-containing protein [Chryseobacterium vietnamense]
MTAYPNPFSDAVTISDISKVKSVSVMDASGKTVRTIEKPASQIYLNDVKAGLHFIILKMTDGTVKTIKAIKK